MNREPAAIIGAVTTAIASILALVVAFGLDISDDQQTAVLGVVAAVGPLVAAFFIRPKVTPVNDPQTDSGIRLVPLTRG